MVDAPASKAGAEQAWGFESPLRHHRLTVRFRNTLVNSEHAPRQRGNFLEETSRASNRLVVWTNRLFLLPRTVCATDTPE